MGHDAIIPKNALILTDGESGVEMRIYRNGDNVVFSMREDGGKDVKIEFGYYYTEMVKSKIDNILSKALNELEDRENIS